MPSVVLIGDSILDNGPYTRPEPDTTAHLARLLGAAWQVERLAQDGSTMADLRFQLDRMTGRPDWAVLSIGGNDATEHLELLEGRVADAMQLLDQFVTIGDDFAARYEQVLAGVIERARHVVLLTIYEPPLEPAPLARLARVPLAVLNDRIVRLAAAHGLTVLDLRAICTAPADFVNEIEPSPRGAAKIAEALSRLLRGESAQPSARVVAG